MLKKETTMITKEAVKKLRHMLLMEQKEFAQALGISPSAVCNYERGTRCPAIHIIKKMKELADKNDIQISISDFLNFKKYDEAA